MTLVSQWPGWMLLRPFGVARTFLKVAFCCGTDWEIIFSSCPSYNLLAKVMGEHLWLAHNEASALLWRGSGFLIKGTSRVQMQGLLTFTEKARGIVGSYGRAQECSCTRNESRAHVSERSKGLQF